MSSTSATVVSKRTAHALRRSIRQKKNKLTTPNHPKGDTRNVYTVLIFLKLDLMIGRHTPGETSRRDEDDSAIVLGAVAEIIQ